MAKLLSCCVRSGRVEWIRALCCALAAVALLLTSAASLATTFAVNNPADVPDVNHGNGICETAAGNGICTVRAAIQEANAHAGPDRIELEANTTYQLTRPGTRENEALNGDLDVTDDLTLVGAGPDSTIVDGNGALTGERVFHIARCRDNAQTVDGGCLHGTFTASISGITIRHGDSAKFDLNSDQPGGGIDNDSTLTLDNCVVTGNTVSGSEQRGGGIANFGSLVLTNSAVTDNTTGTQAAQGGGIYTFGQQLTITNSTISGNKTYASNGSGGTGGGISVRENDTLTLRNSTISGNHAAQGGGIFTKSGTAIVNSTISGNFSDGDGGGMYVNAGTTELHNATITQNLANYDETGTASGGGLATGAGGGLTFTNSIIALNELIVTMPFLTLENDDCAGTIASFGDNIMHDVNGAHCTIVGAAVTIADPLLDDLHYNGGPTQTHALLNGSPAIDAGNPSGCRDQLGALLTTDQRGVHRPYGAHCDIGAFETDSIFADSFDS